MLTVSIASTVRSCVIFFEWINPHVFARSKNVFRNGEVSHTRESAYYYFIDTRGCTRFRTHYTNSFCLNGEKSRTCTPIERFTVNTKPKTKPIPLKRTLYIVDRFSCVAQLLHCWWRRTLSVDRRRWLMSFFVSKKKIVYHETANVSKSAWLMLLHRSHLHARCTVLAMCDFSFLLFQWILFFFFSFSFSMRESGKLVGVVIILYELFGFFDTFF